MAGIKSFVKQIDPQNQSVTQTQSNVNTALKQIANSAIIDGVLIKGVNVGTADTIVNHKLGREPLGWIVVRKFNPDRFVRPRTGLLSALSCMSA